MGVVTEPNLDAPEPDPLTASSESVYEVLQHPYAWDVDQHDGHWWAMELKDRDFFSELDDFDRAAILAGIARMPEYPWNKDLQSKLRSAIKDVLEE